MICICYRQIPKFLSYTQDFLRHGIHGALRKILITTHVHDARKPVNPGTAGRIESHPGLIYAGIDAGGNLAADGNNYRRPYSQTAHVSIYILNPCKFNQFFVDTGPEL